MSVKDELIIQLACFCVQKILPFGPGCNSTTSTSRKRESEVSDFRTKRGAKRGIWELEPSITSITYMFLCPEVYYTDLALAMKLIPSPCSSCF